MADWKFYGRREQLADLERMLDRNRWFFAKVSLLRGGPPMPLHRCPFDPERTMRQADSAAAVPERRSAVARSHISPTVRRNGGTTEIHRKRSIFGAAALQLASVCRTDASKTARLPAHVSAFQKSSDSLPSFRGQPFKFVWRRCRPAFYGMSPPRPSSAGTWTRIERNSLRFRRKKLPRSRRHIRV